MHDTRRKALLPIAAIISPMENAETNEATLALQKLGKISIAHGLFRSLFPNRFVHYHDLTQTSVAIDDVLIRYRVEMCVTIQ